MRLRRRALLIGSALLVIVIACVLFNLEGWRATYWAERAASCGVLTFGVAGLTTSTDEAQRAADCFTQAASRCRAVVLRADSTNVDSGATYFFLVESPVSPYGACEVASSWNARSIHQSVGGAAACRSVARQPHALRFSGCGPEGSIILPIVHGGYLTS